MQKNFRPFLALTLTLTIACTGFVSIARADNNAKPLMVIRFNQAHVYYDQQLYSAISQAVAAKPGVVFDVVSNAPSSGNSSTDQQWVTTASHNTQAVVATMQKFGVPKERMNITGKAAPDLHYDETRIYAR